MKTESGANWCQCDLADKQLHQLLEKVDSEFAELVRRGGCLECLIGVLHRSDYKRKPRGGLKKDEEVYRESFCCDQDGCRKRHTPPSVRFLGRKVYLGFIVVLVSVMRHGNSPERMKVLREVVGVDVRTVERWRQWWLDTFVRSRFWKGVRARFMPPICEPTLPASLWEVFGADRRDRLLDLLRFLSPMTTTLVALER